MKRFIHIQSDDLVFFDDDGNPKPGFAFWDTIYDSFDTVGGHQAWDSWTDFVNDARADGMARNSIDRYASLAVNWVIQWTP